jgi:tRNA(fMet)-specific endonuclease VapC
VILRYLLDTNTISDPSRLVPNLGILRRLRQHDGEVALAAPVWHELRFGLERLPPSKKRQKVEDFLRTLEELPVLAYDAAAAEWHARERARLESIGKSPPFLDSQIAAVANANHLIVVTSNVRDFEIFDGISIENWRE